MELQALEFEVNVRSVAGPRIDPDAGSTDVDVGQMTRKHSHRGDAIGDPQPRGTVPACRRELRAMRSPFDSPDRIRVTFVNGQVLERVCRPETDGTVL